MIATQPGIAEMSSARTHVAEYAPEAMRRLVKRSFCTMSYQAPAGSPSAMTSFEGVGLGAVDVFRHEGIGKRVGYRQPADIRNHWVDDFVISMPLKAQMATQQDGHDAKLVPGNFVFLSTSRPFAASVSGTHPNEICAAFLVRVSGSLLRERAPLLDDCCGLPLPIKAGAGRIMQTLFELAISEAAALSPSQRARFNEMLLSAIANVAIEVSETAAARLPRPRAHERLREAAIAYIHCHLSNPELGAAQIAKHCQVSERYLQAAFAAVSTTVGACIRERRLQQCRTALRNPALRDRSIIEIALRWGFSDAPYFSRAYKARFGQSPSAERA